MNRHSVFGVFISLGLAVAAICATILLVRPIPQDPSYHSFADQRLLCGIPHFGDVVSNAAFVLVGLWGLCLVRRQSSNPDVERAWERLPHLVFFAAIVLVGIGSAYYHLDPTTETLFWDRLPMTIAFMALSSAIIADRVHAATGVFVMLPLLQTVGIAALLHWQRSEALGQGDLRWYGLVQFYPMLAIPMICLFFPAKKGLHGKYLYGLIGYYGAAKVLEYLDHDVFALTGDVVSGHSLKHIVAALATAMVALAYKATPSHAAHY